MTPLVAGTRDELAQALKDARGRGEQVALVPTMGALHPGHAVLVRHARELVGPDGQVVVSIFVNPLQFGRGEDLERYPRSFEADLELCADAGADVVFAPSVEEVYPGGEPEVTVDPGPLGDLLEGRTRPGHFHGVLTVVAKLFGLVTPNVAVFGEKDYQQLVLVRQMAADLCLPVEVVGVPTVREPSGLAMSSRNRYLDEDQRRIATALSAALTAGAEAAVDGAQHAMGAARAVLRQAHGVDLDYLELTGPRLGVPPRQGPARLLIAARVGSARLIDNVAVHIGREDAGDDLGTSGDH